MDVKHAVFALKKRIDRVLMACGRSHITLMAVSKTRSIDEIRQAIDAGIFNFGENYLQEALPKIESLRAFPLVWHFIGPIQRNKIKRIATHFQWVHSVSSIETAKALDQHVPSHATPLNICIQLNIDNEPSKSGITTNELPEFITEILKLKNLKLRGLMIIPKPFDPSQNENPFVKTASIMKEVNQTFDLSLDTLSMGMSSDFEEAILAGSTCVRIGTEIFGARS